MKASYKYISLLLFSGLILFVYTVIASANTAIANGSPKAKLSDAAASCLSATIDSKGFSIMAVVQNIFPVLKKLN
jgi:hypothetical protein